MSNIRTAEATVEGLHGPFFDGLEPIQRLFKRHPERINRMLLDTFEEQFPTIRALAPWPLTTEDGYEWAHGGSFRFYNRHVQIFIPCMKDSAHEDGTYADRHVALFYEGRPISSVRLERLMRKVATAFEDAYESLYGRILP